MYSLWLLAGGAGGAMGDLPKLVWRNSAEKPEWDSGEEWDSVKDRVGLGANALKTTAPPPARPGRGESGKSAERAGRSCVR